MKKGRPAHVVHMLRTKGGAETLAQILFAETGSLGLRRYLLDRVALPRRTTTVNVDGYPISIKHHQDPACLPRRTVLWVRAAAARTHKNTVHHWIELASF
ncbi:nickel insertion protein [Saccharopolyspora sp. NPDC050389]|uniref:nickel insertion protein n=1 Tax=Saccharopolyspora sp. NPDC050389 TaxID=3155516 RepID=UPI0033FA8CC0